MILKCKQVAGKSSLGETVNLSKIMRGDCLMEATEIIIEGGDSRSSLNGMGESKIQVVQKLTSEGG